MGVGSENVKVGSSEEDTAMGAEELGKTLLGVAAWVGVAVFAVIAVANWDPLWGFFPVLAAVVSAWAVGEYLMIPSDREGS